MKSRDGKRKRRGEKKKEDQKEKVSEEDPGARKVGKSRDTVFFQ